MASASVAGNKRVSVSRADLNRSVAKVYSVTASPSRRPREWVMGFVMNV